eukprot:jgi/Chlat1/3880/Chrsp26S04168
MAAANIALVTGANRGLGFEVVRHLVQRQPVLPAARVESSLAELEEAVKAEGGSQQTEHKLVGRLQLDVSDPKSVSQAAVTIQQKYSGRVSTLVNNAGIFLDGWDQNTWDESMRTNYHGTMNLTMQLLPHLSDGARIINVTSGYARREFLSASYQRQIEQASTLEDLANIKFDASDQKMSNGAHATYKLTKAMVNRATQILADDPKLTSRGISCSAVDPGWCRTRMGGPSATRSAKQGADSILYLCLHPNPMPTGGFFLDGRPARV